MLRISSLHSSVQPSVFANSKCMLQHQVKGLSKNLLISFCLHGFSDEMLILLSNTSIVGFFFLLLPIDIHSFRTFLFLSNLGMQRQEEDHVIIYSNKFLFVASYPVIVVTLRCENKLENNIYVKW